MSTIVFLMLAFLPLAFWMEAAIAACLAGFHLGFLPHYNHPDPKTLPGGLLPRFGILTAALLLCLVIGSVIALMKNLHVNSRIPAALLALPLVWSLCWVLEQLTGFVDWYLD